MTDYLEKIQQGVDYIEEHLEEDLLLQDVSKAAAMSHFHFQRIFKALTGETLKTYVRARRMANALELLLSTDRRILDIALVAGYQSQESFSRAFKKAFRMTPGEYRCLGRGHLFLKKVRFDEEYLQHINTGISLEPRVETRPAMKIVGMKTHFYGVESEKNNLGQQLPVLWDQFVPRSREIPAQIPLPNYGVISQEYDEAERLEYIACVEVKEAAALPEGMILGAIPPATWAIFTHRGLTQDIDHTVNYIYATWLSSAGVRRADGPDLEMYDQRWRRDSAESVMSYAIPIA